MSFGYNLGAASVGLFIKEEQKVTEGINKKNAEITRHLNTMQDLENFLTTLANRTTDSHRLDMTSPEDQKTIDHLRKQGLGDVLSSGEQEGQSLDHIFPPGKYEWKGGEIENLIRMINQHIEGPLQRILNMKTEEVVLDEHGLAKVLSMFEAGLKRTNGLNEKILDNMRRH